MATGTRCDITSMEATDLRFFKTRSSATATISAPCWRSRASIREAAETRESSFGRLPVKGGAGTRRPPLVPFPQPGNETPHSAPGSPP